GTRPFSTHLELADVNVPVEFAGTQIRPGDIVVGDGDGLVIIPADKASQVLFQALDIADLEKELEIAIKHEASLSEIEKFSKRKKTLKEHEAFLQNVPDASIGK
ncbi:partial 3-hexulose-6-phosphate synthase, partial [Anaerolineae bacterium]